VSEPSGRGIRFWISLVLLVGGCLCFALMHAMPMTSHAFGSRPGKEWTSDYGWQAWPDIVDAVGGLPHEIRAGGVDAETWMMVATIAGFVLGGILSLGAPLLVSLLRSGRLFRWIALICVALAWISGPGLVVIDAVLNPQDSDYFRWEYGVYVWMASGPLTLLGLFLLPARQGARNASSAGASSKVDT